MQEEWNKNSIVFSDTFQSKKWTTSLLYVIDRDMQYKAKPHSCGLGLFFHNGGSTSSRNRYCREDKEELWKEGGYKAGLWHST